MAIAENSRKKNDSARPRLPFDAFDGGLLGLVGGALICFLS